MLNNGLPDDQEQASRVTPIVPKKQALYLALLSLKPEERREVMAQFCSYCGSDDPLCRCLKEE